MTAYDLIYIVIRSRNRPSATSTSVSITRRQGLFLGIHHAKTYPFQLSLMIIIILWVGLNQYRVDFTVLCHKNYCYWKPLFHWLLDIALTNSYLLAKASRTPRIGESKDYYKYRQFLELLYKALMAYGEALEHTQILRPTRVYCAHC